MATGSCAGVASSSAATARATRASRLPLRILRLRLPPFSSRPNSQSAPATQERGRHTSIDPTTRHQRQIYTESPAPPAPLRSRRWWQQVTSRRQPAPATPGAGTKEHKHHTRLELPVESHQDQWQAWMTAGTHQATDTSTNVAWSWKSGGHQHQ